MDFRLTDEQQALRTSARELLARECPPSLARARYDDPAASADALWRHVTSSGWTAIAVPEAQGGLGLSVIELCLVLEECGRALAPIPLWETAGLLTPLLREVGDTDRLPAVAAGSLTGTAVTSAGLAPEAHAVDVVAVGGDDGRTRVVDAASLHPTLLDSLDRTRALCAVEGAGPPPPGAALDEATVALCAETVGVTRHLLDTTVAYAKVREQFGVPIGSFQALKHKLADVLLDVERASAATYYAAMCVAAGDADAPRATCVAKASIGDASRHAAKEAVQIHGGIGFTWEHDLHLYIRRVYANEPLLGGSVEARAKLATLLAL
jgi:alkylation response protein AidB-like acyl-CoA dehydrogenase